MPIKIVQFNGTQPVKLVDSDGNEATTTEAASITAATPGIVVLGKDSSGLAQAIPLGSDGRVQVATPPPVAPAGTTAVDSSAYGDVNANTTSETAYVITNTKTLKILRFQGGSDVSNDGSKVELYYQPNGNTTGQVLIAVGYTNGSNFQYDLAKEFVGNGTRRILMRRVNPSPAIGGSTNNIFGRWEGYEV